MNEFPLKLKEYLAVLALELKKKKFTTTISTLVICDNGNKHHPYIITFWPKTSKNRVNICIYPSNYGLISYFDRQFNYYTDVCEEDIHFNFYISDREDYMFVYETAFPQIEWPIGDNLNLEGFDITIIQRECEDALEYLDEFDKTHSLGEQDDTYKIIWDL